MLPNIKIRYLEWILKSRHTKIYNTVGDTHAQIYEPLPFWSVSIKNSLFGNVSPVPLSKALCSIERPNEWPQARTRYTNGERAAAHNRL